MRRHNESIHMYAHDLVQDLTWKIDGRSGVNQLYWRLFFSWKQKPTLLTPACLVFVRLYVDLLISLE